VKKLMIRSMDLEENLADKNRLWLVYMHNGATKSTNIHFPNCSIVSTTKWQYYSSYAQQGRAHIRRLHPGWAVRPALMSRAAHAVESKAVVRIEVAVSPRPCLGCTVELVLRVAPLRRGVPPR
jgi:hypothetical protein